MCRALTRRMALLILLTFCSVGQAMDYYFSDEQTLSDDYATLIQGFWHNQVQTGTFKSQDGLDIAYAFSLHPQARGSIVISSGRIEGYLKYKEVLFELYQNHFSVFILDHRGQGLSGRMNGHAHQGYVRHYDDYVADLKQFYDQTVLPNSQHKPFMLGHSMGSAIGTLYLSAYPQDFRKAVFSSPMYGIKSPIPLWLAKGLLNTGQTLNRWFASRPWYFIGQGDYLAVPFAINLLTHSKVRYQIFRDEYEQTPRLQLGGVTFDWLQASLDALDRLEVLAPGLQTEILVLQAGSDLVVDNARQDHLCALMPNCQLKVIDKAKHELLMEADSYRREAMTRMLDFFQAE